MPNVIGSFSVLNSSYSGVSPVLFYAIKVLDVVRTPNIGSLRVTEPARHAKGSFLPVEKLNPYRDILRILDR
jgi:hypothetical protein